MEIILQDIVCNSTKADKCLNKVNYTFKENSINFCSGLSGRLLRDLLTLKKQRESGYLFVNPNGRLSDIGYVGNNPLKEFTCKTVAEQMLYFKDNYHLKYNNVQEKIKSALLMVGLDESYLSRVITSLSTSELKKVSLACVLFYNPQVLIVDYFEKGLNYKDIEYFKKLFKKLKIKYNRNIIICSDNISNYLDILDEYVIFNNGVLEVKGTNKELYNNVIYKYIEEPHIIKFINLVRKKKGVELDNYIDIKELIKAIYRDVENK